MAAAQATTEQRVLELLREEVRADKSVNLRITRAYSPVFFPSATFYQTVFLPPGVWDLPPARAALVVTDSHVTIIRTPDDLAEVWRAAIVDKTLRPFEVELACTDLVLGSGLIPERARIIETVSEIPKRRREELQPQSALRRIRPTVQHDAPEGVRVAFNIWSGDLLEVTCLSSGRELRVSMDTLARSRRNEP
ncbi:MAG: hypothetical protein SFU57_11645 [Gemmatimonadales bacterium]|nr:hypothetical protein [Gemmatimonadales bacterium]